MGILCLFKHVTFTLSFIFIPNPLAALLLQFMVESLSKSRPHMDLAINLNFINDNDYKNNSTFTILVPHTKQSPV